MVAAAKEGEGGEERWQQRKRRKMRPATKDGGNGFGSGYGISPEQKKERWGRRGQRRSSATETLLGRRRWPQRQRSRQRKQGGEALVKKMAMAAFLGDGGGGRRSGGERGQGRWRGFWRSTVAAAVERQRREGEQGRGVTVVEAVALTANEDGDEGGAKVRKEAQWTRRRRRGFRRDRGEEEEKGEKGDGGGPAASSLVVGSPTQRSEDEQKK